MIPTYNLNDRSGNLIPWDTIQVQKIINKTSLRTSERLIEKSKLLPRTIKLEEVVDEKNNPLKKEVISNQVLISKKRRDSIYIIQLYKVQKDLYTIMANDGRSARKWFWLKKKQISLLFIKKCITALIKDNNKNVCLIPTGILVSYFRDLDTNNIEQIIVRSKSNLGIFPASAYQEYFRENKTVSKTDLNFKNSELSHLDYLESESIHIIREVLSESENPVMLYSIGKDSAVMLHLALKAFYPNVPPFPLLHVDTGWKFKMMYEFRNQIAKKTGMKLLIHKNQEGVKMNINPFDSG